MREQQQEQQQQQQQQQGVVVSRVKMQYSLERITQLFKGIAVGLPNLDDCPCHYPEVVMVLAGIDTKTQVTQVFILF